MQQRNTFQKAMTLDAVMYLANHPTADMVYSYIKKKYPQISRTTVYRNLNKLCDLGELTKVKVSGSADRFDHRLEPHYHFICNVCGEMCDLDLPYIEKINDMAQGLGGRKISAHQIMFDGICQNCLSSEIPV